MFQLKFFSNLLIPVKKINIKMLCLMEAYVKYYLCSLLSNQPNIAFNNLFFLDYQMKHYELQNNI